MKTKLAFVATSVAALAFAAPAVAKAPDATVLKYLQEKAIPARYAAECRALYAAKVKVKETKTEYGPLCTRATN